MSKENIQVFAEAVNQSQELQKQWAAYQALGSKTMNFKERGCKPNTSKKS